MKNRLEFGFKTPQNRLTKTLKSPSEITKSDYAEETIDDRISYNKIKGNLESLPPLKDLKVLRGEEESPQIVDK